MDFPELKKILITNDLPGWESQKELSPPYRGNTVKEIHKKNAKTASVLITIYKRNEKLYFPLILRSEYLGNHSGQIALPGGKKDVIDANTRETAIRETNEEIGLEKKKLEIVKKLTPLYIPLSNFYVKPYIAFYEEKEINFKLQEKEVQKIYEIELYQFLFGMKIVKIPMDSKGLVPAFQYEDIIIWGATAMILNEFKKLLRE